MIKIIKSTYLVLIGVILQVLLVAPIALFLFKKETVSDKMFEFLRDIWEEIE